jgi:hypothetical protein
LYLSSPFFAENPQLTANSGVGAISNQEMNGLQFQAYELYRDAKAIMDDFMMLYYRDHQEDFKNPQHGLTSMNLKLLSKYTMRPHIYGAAGVIFYLSNKACDIAIHHMEKINFNVLDYDSFTRSYPYTIEDCGISFIMYYNDIEYVNGNFFFDTNHIDTIAKHTNKYK